MADITVTEGQVAKAAEVLEFCRRMRDENEGNPRGTRGWQRFMDYGTAVVAVEEVLDALGIEVD